ncbi:MAG: alkaline phosphatase [Saprospiraceae bacterium]
MPQRSRFLILFALLTSTLLLTQAPTLAQVQLRSGPMLGYNTMREVAVWVQTDNAAEVELRYWRLDDVRAIQRSASAKTSSKDAFTATLLADSLEQGTAYEYQVLIDGSAIRTRDPLRFTTQELWAFRKDPPPFTFALGSCVYINEEAYDRPGKGYGGQYPIFQSIDSLRPNFMLWLGDNNYLRPGDFQSEGAVYHRYSHSRQVIEMQPMLRNMHHYAIWDDHDYGPNDSDRSFLHKDWTSKAFDLFWPNPPANHPSLSPGNGTAFRYNDAEFFMLDNRTFRAPAACKTCTPKPLLGKGQVDWLIEALSSSTATYKFVAIGGQVLNSAEVWENYIHHHAVERKELLDRIVAEGVENVVFLTGDRHHTELSKMDREGVTMYDFTVSPLTSGASKGGESEGNRHRVEGTYVAERNFGTVTLTGPYATRVATLRIYDQAGKMLWERVL